ncbi:hypothetical protein [Adlercreutzia sp. ZJ473]|uniref:hypothetical protein n=1 Tax=Adlercreutzia sp. ZJ473 TaxID=2722822 RepID=UPI001C12F8BA|nr:hypothetical protein [Adlercreutzia sp. ZJ473]
MKITISEQTGASGIEVTIVCEKANRQVLDIAARLRMLDRKVTVRPATTCGTSRTIPVPA